MTYHLPFQVPPACKERFDRYWNDAAQEKYLQHRYGGSVPFLKYDFDDHLEKVLGIEYDGDAWATVDAIRYPRLRMAEAKAAKQALREYDRAIKNNDAPRVNEIFLALVEIVDEEHWLMVRIAERVLGVTEKDLYSCFDFEDQQGVFDAIEEGLHMIPWYEKCTDFYKRTYTPASPFFEEVTCEFDIAQEDAFRKYREELHEEYRKAILEKAAAKAAEVPPLP